MPGFLELTAAITIGGALALAFRPVAEWILLAAIACAVGWTVFHWKDSILQWIGAVLLLGAIFGAVGWLSALMADPQSDLPATFQPSVRETD